MKKEFFWTAKKYLFHYLWWTSFLIGGLFYFQLKETVFYKIWPVSSAHALGVTQIYVSPSGNDSSSGTISQPVKTLNRARNIVRANNQNMVDDITVFLRGGLYQLSSQFTLTPDDSGTNGHKVIYKNYPNEKPIISGGKTVGNWTAEGALWKSYIGPNLVIRQLYVNGEREIRARSEQPLPIFQKTTDGYLLNTPDISTWGNISDIEFVSTVLWKQYRCGVQSVTAGKIIMQQPCWNNAQKESPTMDTPQYIENARELLDAPQEWYYNQATGYMYYYPYAGQDMSSADVEVPNLTTLIVGNGTSGQAVSNIEFQGITFEYTSWNGPSTNEGYAPLQGTLHYTSQNSTLTKIPAAINLHAAVGVSIESNIFTHLGGAGVTLDQGSQNNSIATNHFTDISGSGIQVGDVDQPHVTTADATSGNIISDNYIRDIGKEFQDAIGIWLGYVAGSVVQRNEVFQLPYSGISIGWGWGNDDPTVAKNNRIENNYVHDHVQTLHDGGGIYSLSAQPGSLISGNVITGQRNLYGAIYLDIGSRGITVSNNAIFDNIQSIFAIGGENTFTGNYWQNRFAGDLDIFLPPPQFGPNTLNNNHVITSRQEVPAGLITAAGIEDGFKDITFLPYPTNLQAACNVSGQQVQLSWNAASSSPKYSISLDNLTDSSTAALGETFATTYQPLISPGQRYRWSIHAISDVLHSFSSTFVCRDMEQPNRPTNVRTQSVGQNQIELLWDASNDNQQVFGYTVFRDHMKVGQTSIPSFTDSGLTANTRYAYTVHATDISGNSSEQSEQVQVTTLSIVPTVVITPLVTQPAVITPLVAQPAAITPVAIGKVLGAEKAVPAFSTIQLTNGKYKLKVGTKTVLLQPFGQGYTSSAWGKTIDLGARGIFTMFISDTRTSKGGIIVYNEKGKQVSYVKIRNNLFARTTNTDLRYDSTTNTVYIAILDQPYKLVRVYSFIDGQYHGVNSVSVKLTNTIISKLRFLTVSKVKILALGIRSKTNSIATWEIHASTGRLSKKTLSKKDTSSAINLLWPITK